MQPRVPAPGRNHAQPLDALWRAGTIIRIVLAGEALAFVLALAPGVAGDRLTYFGLASFAIQWISLLAMGQLYIARRRLGRIGPVGVARAALGALIVSTWVVAGLAWLFLHDLWPAPAEGWPAAMSRLTLMSLTVGLMALAAFRGLWHMQQLALRAKQAEVEALQARIRPHFLFNTLNTGVALLHHRPGDAERLLLDLSDLFRAALSGPAEVSLEEELSLARRYLEIESMRFGARLRTVWHVAATASELRDTALPALSVQPLVENAIRHGIELRARGGTITISVARDADAMVVAVRNPLPEGADGSSRGHGIGLAAVRARLEAMPGGGGALGTSVASGEFTASLRIPAPQAQGGQVTTS